MSSSSKLSAAQKKENDRQSNISSGDDIQDQFDLLTQLVPGAEDLARNHGPLLKLTVAFVKHSLAKQEELWKLAKGMSREAFEEEYRKVYAEEDKKKKGNRGQCRSLSTARGVGGSGGEVAEAGAGPTQGGKRKRSVEEAAGEELPASSKLGEEGEAVPRETGAQ
jgi:hypothetical protein